MAMTDPVSLTPLTGDFDFPLEFLAAGVVAGGTLGALGVLNLVPPRLGVIVARTGGASGMAGMCR